MPGILCIADTSPSGTPGGGRKGRSKMSAAEHVFHFATDNAPLAATGCIVLARIPFEECSQLPIQTTPPADFRTSH
jgi:hypothetical protein